MSFVLGLDLDGVCGDYVASFRHYVARALGVSESSIGEQTSWSFVESGWGITDEAHFRQLHADAVFDGLFRMMPMIPGASENLWKLSDADVHIRVITHRLCVNGGHATAASDTVVWLERKKIPYRDICFVSAKDQVGADVYIDDAPRNVESLRRTGAYVITFDAPYNRHIEGPRARTWDEARELVLEHKERIESRP